MNAEPAVMHPFTLRFADAALEQTFATDYAQKGLRSFRVAVLSAVGGVLLPWLIMDHLLPAVPGPRVRVWVPITI